MEAFFALLKTGMYGGPAEEKTKETLRRMTSSDWERLWELTERHRVSGLAAAALELYPDAGISETVARRFSEMRRGMATQYYTLFSFTTYVVELLREQKLPVYVLKGISLSDLYAIPDARGISDADIYVPGSGAFRRACRLLKKAGFEARKEAWDYHRRFYKECLGMKCLLELHNRQAGYLGTDFQKEKRIQRLLMEQSYEPWKGRAEGVEIPVQQPPEYAFGLVLHALCHMLGQDGGWHLLCDWCVFWKERGQETDTEKFLWWLRESGLEKFAVGITNLCIRYLDMDETWAPWFPKLRKRYGDVGEELLSGMRDADATTAGKDFGRADMTESGSVRQNMRTETAGNAPGKTHLPDFLAGCVREVVRQSAQRFPKASRCYLLLPVLWAATILMFLYNNVMLKRGETLGEMRRVIGRQDFLENIKTSDEVGKKH